MDRSTRYASLACLIMRPPLSLSVKADKHEFSTTPAAHATHIRGNGCTWWHQLFGKFLARD
jgi:hypothetical protein